MSESNAKRLPKIVKGVSDKNVQLSDKEKELINQLDKIKEDLKEFGLIA